MRRAALGLLLLLLAPPAWAAPLQAHREVLPNGLTLLVAERPAIPIVALRAYVRAGSAFDPPAHPGLANLTAELLTRGTASRTGPQLDDAIEFVGGSLDAEAERDGVTVSLSVLKKDLGLGLDLLREVLLTPTFPEAELQRKVKEIQAAIRRSEENPVSVASRELAALLYPGHPYAHPVAGMEASVGARTRAQVAAFHRNRYRPDAAVFSVAGDVKRAEIRQEILRRFGSWSSAGGPPALPSQAPATPPVTRRSVTRELTQSTVFLGRPAVSQSHPDYFPLLVASYILGGGSTSRLYAKLREEAGLVYWVGSHLSPKRYGSSILVSFQTRTEGVGEAVKLVNEGMTSMGQRLVADQELALAKAYLIGSYPLRIDTSSKLAGLLIGVEEFGLGLDYPDRFKAGVGAVTAPDVRRVARRYLDPASFSSVTVGKQPAP
jgi:zinc protease